MTTAGRSGHLVRSPAPQRLHHQNQHDLAASRSDIPIPALARATLIHTGNCDQFSLIADKTPFSWPARAAPALPAPSTGGK